MKTKLALFILILTTLSCQPPKSSSGNYGGMVPYNLNAVMNDGGFEVSWECDLGGNISGYNIYASEQSLEKRYPDGVYPVDLKPVNHPVFPGDTDASDKVEHYLAAGLRNGQKYYVTVRTVYPDKTESDPSREIIVVPGSAGVITMVERFKGENDGYSFEKNKAVGADESLNDLFFHIQNGSKYLASPTRLDGFLNQTLLVRLTLEGDYHKVRQAVNNGEFAPTKDRVEISAGDWVLAKLASGKHVLLHVSSFQAAASQSVTLDYYLCTLTDEIYF